MKIAAAGIATALALVPACSFSADLPSSLSLQTVEPRAFGYTVGDVLERRVVIDPAHDGAIDAASLPKPGRSGRWFLLRRVQAPPGEVRLTYQIANAPEKTDQENLPSLSLRLTGPDGRSREAAIAPFTVTIAPIGRFGAYDTVQATELRPDLEPRPLDTAHARQWLWASAAALLAALALWVAPWLGRRLAIGRSGPFAAAWRAIRRLKTRTDVADVHREALRQLHRALDQTAGATLALDNLDALFANRPWLEPARASLQTLLARSRGTFFEGVPPPALDELAAIAAQCARLEQRR